MAAPGFRPAWAEVDLAAIGANVRAVQAAAGGAAMWAVVKADAYGHGAVPVARAALEAGAHGLAVALVEEGIALREAGISAPVLLLSEPPTVAMEEVVNRRLTPTLYSPGAVYTLTKAIEASPGAGRTGVQVKLDTGMHRAGAAPEAALAVARAVHRHPRLVLEAVWTHLAVADDPARAEVTEAQCAALDRFCKVLEGEGIGPPPRHAANSAGVLLAGANYDMVRSGIALYGYSPNPAVPVGADLLPALSLVARVVQVKELPPGSALSYGLRYRVAEWSTVATVPLGYADGVPRRLFDVGGQVLVGGYRRPIAGTVTMDQILVDCGPGAGVEQGDEVVLLGRQGAQRITADEWAARLGTISYEILCGIGPRVPRVYRP